MPGVKRAPRNSVNDRPARLRLLLRRQRRFVRPAFWGVAFGFLFLVALAAMHRASPGSLIAAVHERFGLATARFGFRVQDIRIEGRANTPEPLLRNALGVRPGDPILGFSLEAARERIEKLSWVDHATVERRLPGTIVVQLQERRPFAIWQNQGKFLLIDRTGQVVTNNNVADFHDLPLVVGAGAPEAAAKLIDALTDRPGLAARVSAAVRVGQRRWNLILKSGMTIMLPEGHEVAALDRLTELDQQHKLLDRPLQFVDLRLPDRMVVRAKAETATPDPAKDSHATAAKRAA
ncbi:MAG TPA: cell division protein FtsQ/DivIB [Acetobacteraceae bacterium]|nr:cell division protein FtsQ/DivIB [Acetobacteraceae bacterium]